MAYRVRATDVISVRDQLLPIWSENLPVRGQLEEKLEWFYREGPHGPGRTFLVEAHPDLAIVPEPHQGSRHDVPSSVALTSPLVVVGMSDLQGNTKVERAAMGSAGVGTRTLWYRGRRLKAALFADLAIDRAHRTGFPVLALLRAVKKQVGLEFDLGYGMPNAKAAPMYRRAGYGELGVRLRYVRVLRSERYVGRRIKHRVSARLFGILADRALRVLDRVSVAMLDDCTPIEWLTDFDSDFDVLWDESRGLAPVLCERSSAFLRWRFMRQPGMSYRIATVRSASSHKLRAYAVIRDEQGVARIVDLFGRDREDVGAMLTRLIPDLYERGFHAISFEVLGPRWVGELLATFGFWPRTEFEPVVMHISDAHKLAHELADPNAWYLTDLDEDA